MNRGHPKDSRPRVVHVTAHMGGGIGKVLSRITAFAQTEGRYCHEIVCLEKPEKTGFVEYARKSGVTVHLAPEPSRIIDICAPAAIVHFDWWHHPLMAHCLVTTKWPPLRTVVWSHISGVSFPMIPRQFVAAPHAFIVSTPYSFDNPDMRQECANVTMVHSSGGFDDMPAPDRSPNHPFTAGYVGTLNFSKMHPEFIDYCADAGLTDARFLLVGDQTTRPALEEQARKRGIMHQVAFAGYVDPVWRALQEIDVLAYLLNPGHYGTTENALLEAMACGIVPIVLDQCAEKHLVRHGETGMVVHDAKEFGQALRLLKERPEERKRLGMNAREFVTKELSCENTVQKLHECYDAVMERPARAIDFGSVFGPDPADWFLSCIGPYRRMYGNAIPDGAERLPSILTEPTKSSVYHFLRYFPKNDRLRKMAERTDSFRKKHG